MFLTKEGSRNSYNNRRKPDIFKKNFKKLFGSEPPHMDTVHLAMEALEPQELDSLKAYLISKLLKKKVFHSQRLFGKYHLVAIDGTGKYGFESEPYAECPYRTSEKGKRNWSQPVLEAHWVGNNGMSLSIDTEWIVNETDYDPKDEKKKQDCELKAFGRLAKTLKKQHPDLPICILADGLYPNETFFKICEKNGWRYIVTFKDGNLPTVWEEVMLLHKTEVNNRLEKELVTARYQETSWKYQWHNAIAYQKRHLNWVELQQETYDVKEKEMVESKHFVFLSDLELSQENVQEICKAGRDRWRIENEGFNTLKNHGYAFKHKFARKSLKAAKNYHQCMNIAHLINQLMQLSLSFRALLVKKNTLAAIWEDLRAFLKMVKIDRKLLQVIKKEKCRIQLIC